MPVNEIIVISVIVLIICGATAYIVKAKRNGKKCIGCPYGGACKKRCTCSSNEKE